MFEDNSLSVPVSDHYTSTRDCIIADVRIVATPKYNICDIKNTRCWVEVNVIWNMKCKDIYERLTYDSTGKPQWKFLLGSFRMTTEKQGSKKCGIMTDTSLEWYEKIVFKDFNDFQNLRAMLHNFCKVNGFMQSSISKVFFG